MEAVREGNASSAEEPVSSWLVYGATEDICECRICAIFRNVQRARRNGLFPVLCDERITRSQENEGGHVEGGRERRVPFLRCH